MMHSNHPTCVADFNGIVILSQCYRKNLKFYNSNHMTFESTIHDKLSKICLEQKVEIKLPKNHNYLITYPHFIDYFEQKEELTESDVVFGGTLFMAGCQLHLN